MCVHNTAFFFQAVMSAHIAENVQMKHYGWLLEAARGVFQF